MEKCSTQNGQTNTDFPGRYELGRNLYEIVTAPLPNYDVVFPTNALWGELDDSEKASWDKRAWMLFRDTL